MSPVSLPRLREHAAQNLEKTFPLQDGTACLAASLTGLVCTYQTAGPHQLPTEWQTFLPAHHALTRLTNEDQNMTGAQLVPILDKLSAGEDPHGVAEWSATAST